MKPCVDCWFCLGAVRAADRKCTAFDVPGPVSGRLYFPRCIDMRKDETKCGAAGVRYVDARVRNAEINNDPFRGEPE